MAERLRIRRARVSEAPLLTDLVMRSKAHWGYDEKFMAMCLAELTVEPAAIEAGELWVADAEGAVVGVMQIVPGAPAAEVHLMFVEPGAIGGGVGGALFAHAETRARVHGAERLDLDADPNAVPFYERMGMRIVGEAPSGSIPGRMLPRMEKRLAAGAPDRAA